MGIKSLHNNLLQTGAIRSCRMRDATTVVFDFNIIFHKIASTITKLSKIKKLYKRVAKYILSHAECQLRYILFIDKGSITRKCREQAKRLDVYPVKQAIMRNASTHINLCIQFLEFLIETDLEDPRYSDFEAYLEGVTGTMCHRIDLNPMDLKRFDEFSQEIHQCTNRIVTVFCHRFDAEFAMCKLCASISTYLPMSSDQDMVALATVNHIKYFIYERICYKVRDQQLAILVTYLTILINHSDYFDGIYGIACHERFLSNYIKDKPGFISDMQPDLIAQRSALELTDINKKIIKRIFKVKAQDYRKPKSRLIVDIASYLTLDLSFYQEVMVQEVRDS